MKIALIYNPVAGGAHRFNRPARLAKHLRRAYHEVLVYSTHQPGDATDLARQAITEGAEVVVAVGGDGTVNEVIQGMAGSDIPLAVYPAGTTNVWCKQVRMPQSPQRAARVIGQGSQRQIDLGRADGQYFLLMTGIGLDGEITQAVNLDLKKKIGKLAYALAAARLGLHFRGSYVKLILDPDSEHPRHLRLHTSLIIVTNTERYAVIKLAREAQLDDGQLELLVFNEKNLFSRFKRLYSIASSHTERDHNIQRYQVRRAIIEVEDSLGVQIDGDPHGRTNNKLPMSIECVPAILRVIVPRNASPGLFSLTEQI